MGWAWGGSDRASAETHRETLRENETLRMQNEVLESKIEDVRASLERAQEVQEALSDDLSTAQEKLALAEKINTSLNVVLVDSAREHNRALVDERRQFEKEIAVLRAENRELRTRADLAQNNFEWSRLMLNKSETDRVALTTYILRTPMPAFAIEREQVVEHRDAAGVAAPVKDRADEETAVGQMAASFGISFEDMGDDAAKREGLTHDNDGSVVLQQ